MDIRRDITASGAFIYLDAVGSEPGAKTYATKEPIGPLCVKFERYRLHACHVTDVFVAVEWADTLHIFDRKTGKCLESEEGLMRGFRLTEQSIADLNKAIEGILAKEAEKGAKVRPHANIRQFLADRAKRGE